MKRPLFFLLFLCLLAYPSCYYDVEEELYPDMRCDTEGVTYSQTVVPVLEENCLICHSDNARQGGVVLEGYNNLKRRVDDGSFLGAIKHQPGFAAMPQGGPQLPECTIARMEAWVEQGAPNN